MNSAYLILGGNMGNRVKNLETACIFITQRAGTVIQKSAYYQTAAWGNTEQPDFLNQVLLLHTSLAAPALMPVLLNIESLMGRVRNKKNDPRIIDIDLLLYNDEIYQQPQLTVPHPQLQNRRFVLAPLNELAPQLVHPVLHKTIAQLLIECPDTLDVKKF